MILLSVVIVLANVDCFVFAVGVVCGAAVALMSLCMLQSVFVFAVGGSLSFTCFLAPRKHVRRLEPDVSFLWPISLGFMCFTMLFVSCCTTRAHA